MHDGQAKHIMSGKILRRQLDCLSYQVKKLLSHFYIKNTSFSTRISVYWSIYTSGTNYGLIFVNILYYKDIIEIL